MESGFGDSRKADGRQAAQGIEVVETAEPTKVADLMDALKASVEATKEEKEPAKRACTRKKAAAS